jgi:hypothetical protein
MSLATLFSFFSQNEQSTIPTPSFAFGVVGPLGPQEPQDSDKRPFRQRETDAVAPTSDLSDQGDARIHRSHESVFPLPGKGADVHPRVTP